jgi:hypothetical protein
MLVIPVDKVVDKKRIIGKKGWRGGEALGVDAPRVEPKGYKVLPKD